MTYNVHILLLLLHIPCFRIQHLFYQQLLELVFSSSPPFNFKHGCFGHAIIVSRLLSIMLLLFHVLSLFILLLHDYLYVYQLILYLWITIRHIKMSFSRFVKTLEYLSSSFSCPSFGRVDQLTRRWSRAGLMLNVQAECARLERHLHGSTSASTTLLSLLNLSSSIFYIK